MYKYIYIYIGIHAHDPGSMTLLRCCHSVLVLWMLLHLTTRDVSCRTQLASGDVLVKVTDKSTVLGKLASVLLYINMGGFNLSHQNMDGCVVYH